MSECALVFQFSTSHEFASWVICESCGSPFSHVDARRREGDMHVLYGASNSPAAPIVRGNANGVAYRPDDYQQFKRRRRAIVPVTQAQYDQFWALAEGELGKAFDEQAISFTNHFSDQPFKRNWRYDEHWFCPELQGWLCERIDLWGYPLMIGKNRLTPHALLNALWPRMANRATFWLPPPDMALMPGEEQYLENMDPEQCAALFGAA